MTRSIWNGEGLLLRGMAHWTKRDGTLVGRPFIRRAAALRLRKRWGDLWSLAERKRAIEETVGNDEWVASRSGQTAGSIARDVEDHALETIYINRAKLDAQD